MHLSNPTIVISNGAISCQDLLEFADHEPCLNRNEEDHLSFFPLSVSFLHVSISSAMLGFIKCLQPFHQPIFCTHVRKVSSWNTIFPSASVQLLRNQTLPRAAPAPTSSRYVPPPPKDAVWGFISLLDYYDCILLGSSDMSVGFQGQMLSRFTCPDIFIQSWTGSQSCAGVTMAAAALHTLACRPMLTRQQAACHPGARAGAGLKKHFIHSNASAQI